MKRSPCPAGAWLVDRLASVPQDIRLVLQGEDLVAAPPEAVDDEFLQAVGIEIAANPTLASVICDAVGQLHLLCAPPGFDVSHSQPRWPNRIFVSVPGRTDPVGVLRFAEGVIHEAMHLELTLQEAVQPLIADRTGEMASPWRGAPRPYQGVLHGLFVFACILAYFQSVVERFEGLARAHVEGRLAQIRNEIKEIDLHALGEAATPVGAQLILQWARVADQAINAKG